MGFEYILGNNLANLGFYFDRKSTYKKSLNDPHHVLLLQCDLLLTNDPRHLFEMILLP